MTTFLDLQTAVQQRVIDLPPTVLAAVPRLINHAIRSIQRKYNFRAMEQSVTMITAVGSLTPTPNTIANFKEYRDKGPYLIRNLSEAKRFITASEPDASMFERADATLPDEPHFLFNTTDINTGATTFSIFPYPDALSDWNDAQYRIVVPVYVYSADLVNSGDANWFTNNAADYIEREAAGQAFGLDWDYNSMAILLQEADKKYKEIKLADKTNRLSSVDTLVPMWQGANQPQVRK